MDRRTPPPTLASRPGPVALAAPDRGTKVGRYVVVEVVGRGGMGVVVAAFDPELDRKVAIKLLHRSDGGATRDSVGRTRMLREGQALARLSHKNVVAVHDVGVHEGRVFIAMEFVAGLTMDEWITRNQPGWATIVAHYIEAGRGLQAAHAAGLVHRDFKPHNVLVGDDGRVRVTDFGLARSRSDAEASSAAASVDSQSGDASTGELMLEATASRTDDDALGTPGYMAPEQRAGVVVDPRADQFSFCVALYEAVYGELPFAGRTAAAIARRVARGRVRPPAAGRVVPGWLRRALLRGLRAEPDDRYASMGALLSALAQDPYRRWRRAALIVVPPLALGGWWWRDAGTSTDACARVQDPLVGVWDAPRRDAIEARFRRTALPYAASSWDTVRVRLDGLAGAWGEAQRAICEATAEELPQGLGRRMTCLHRRFEELRAYSDLLVTADPALVEHAVSTVDALGTVAQCDGTRPSGQDIPPQAQRRIGEALARARVLGESGQYPAAVRAASEARTAAEHVQDRWLVAEATFELGRVQEAAGRMEEAQQTYHDAFSAGVAARHDEVVLRAAMGVAALLGDRNKDFTAAENWVEHAQGALERMEAAGESFQGQLDNLRGRLAHDEGDYDRARDAFVRALERRSASLGSDSPLLASYHVNLGHTLASLGEFASAIEHMRRALRLEEAEYGAEHPHVATTLAALCSVEREVGAVDSAIADCRRSVAILRATVGDDHPRTGTALVNLGTALEDAGQEAEALVYFDAALKNAKVAWGEGHPRTALVLNNLAVHHQMYEHYPEAESYARQALAVFETALGRDHPTTASVTSNLANVLARQGKYQEASALLRSTIAVLETRLGAEHPDVGLALGMLGETLVAADEATASLPYLERALRIFEASDGRPLETASARFALGATLFEVGADRPRGLALVREALQLFVQAGARPERIGDVEAWLAESAPEVTE